MELDAALDNNYNGINSMATHCGNDIINDLNTTHDHSRTRQDLEDYKDAKGECSVTSESCHKMSVDDGAEVNYDSFKEESIKIEEHELDIKSEMLDTDGDAEISCSLRQWPELENGYDLKLQDCNRSTQKQDFDSNNELESIKIESDTESNVAAMQSEYNDASAEVNDTVHEHSRSRHDLEDYNDAMGKCCTTSENCPETSFHDGIEEVNCNSFIKSEMLDTGSDAEITSSLQQWSELEKGYNLELRDCNRSTQKQDFDSNDQLESVKMELYTESNAAAMQSVYNDASAVVNNTAANYIFLPEHSNSDYFEEHNESSGKSSTKYSGVKTELDTESNVAAMQSEYNDASAIVKNTAANYIFVPESSNSDYFEERNESSGKSSTKYSGLLRQYNKLDPMNYNASLGNSKPSTISAESFTKQGNCVNHTGAKPYKCHQCNYTYSRKDNLIKHMRNHTGEKPYTCDQCDYTCSKKGRLIMHMRKHTGEKPYKCDLCDYACSQKNNLMRHNMRNHTVEKPFKCDQCDYTCSEKDQLIVHMRKYTGEKPYKCDQCDYACPTKNYLMKHMRNHTEEKPYKCDQCDYACSHKHNLMRHNMKNHTGEKPFKCDQCDYACSEKALLITHMSKHTGEKPYKCEQCDYACSTKNYVIKHMKKHTGEKPYKCDQCDYACSKNNNLMRHMRKHTGEKPFKCDQCDYACSGKEQLIVHMRKHTGEKPYKCDQCDFACSTKSYLIVHMRKHTGEKPYKCYQCRCACSTKTSLILHMRKHTGEKTFKCDQCDYACSRKDYLKVHNMRNHGAEKPFKCDQCDYASSAKTYLMVHMRKHTGEKPYKCDQCDYVCSAKNKLMKHMRKHTGEKPYKGEL